MIFEIPYGTYHVGSHNSLNRYDICSLIFKEVGLEHRIEELFEVDKEKYKDHTRDVRLCTNKIKSFELEFSEPTHGIKKCLNEFKIKL